VKTPFTDTHLLPTMAILDPEMTVTMPRQLQHQRVWTR